MKLQHQTKDKYHFIKLTVTRMGFYNKKFKLIIFDLLSWLVLVGPSVSFFYHPRLPWWYLVTQTIDLHA